MPCNTTCSSCQGVLGPLQCGERAYIDYVELIPDGQEEPLRAVERFGKRSASSRTILSVQFGVQIACFSIWAICFLTNLPIRCLAK
jgi:hypothetical protein